MQNDMKQRHIKLKKIAIVVGVAAMIILVSFFVGKPLLKNALTKDFVFLNQNKISWMH